MRAVTTGGVEAFEALYDRYVRLVYSTAYGVLEDSHSAEDVVQEVFVRIWRRPQQYVEERGRFVGWLLSVTRNRAIDEYRSRRRRTGKERQIIDQPAGELIASEAPAVEFHRVELVDQRALVREALQSLPKEQRVTIELAYFKGLTQAEIAEAQGAPLGTVKTRIRLGMQKLRIALDGRVGTIDSVRAAEDKPRAAGGGPTDGTARSEGIV